MLLPLIYLKMNVRFNLFWTANKCYCNYYI